MSIANQFKRTEARKKSAVVPPPAIADKPVKIEGSRVNTPLPALTGPIPKQKRGRPPTGFDPKTYHREYQRDKRAADKLGISVKEFRSQKGQGK